MSGEQSDREAAVRSRRPHRSWASAVLAALVCAGALAAAGALPAVAAAEVPSGTIVASPAATNRFQVAVSSRVAGATEMLVRLAGSEWPLAWSPFQPVVPLSLIVPGVKTVDGPRTIEARYRNAEGESAVAMATVFLDRKKPKTIGFSEEVVRGGLVKLEFKVKDRAPSCGLANVTLVVYRYGKLKAMFKLYGVQTDKKRYRQFRCRWDRGWYTYKVKATDAAGNACKMPGFGVLFVK